MSDLTGRALVYAMHGTALAHALSEIHAKRDPRNIPRYKQAEKMNRTIRAYSKSRDTFTPLRPPFPQTGLQKYLLGEIEDKHYANLAFMLYGYKRYEPIQNEESDGESIAGSIKEEARR